ncbi:MAG: hypothetical protein K0R43_2622 [Pseudoduganella sp.]|jgi:DNA-binding response OmpR family regulator|nr:hypothetical protein [Pseudoduganella sp.]
MNARVLIVDDSLTVRADLQEAFAERGIETACAETLAEARAALAQPGIGLLILDVLLPDGDGIELLRELRAGGATLPVLVLSTEAQVADRVRGLATGSSDYVGKPYDRDALVARAATLLERQRGSAAPHSEAAVLVIDDSLTFREHLAAQLRESGFAVEVAGSGEEGLRSMARRRPAAVVVDGVLPGMDGAEVVRTLRLDAALRGLPCVLLTGSSDERAELRALDSGADAFVRKDEDIELILARVRAVLRKSADAAHERHDSLLGAKRILAVDDSPTFLDQLAQTLTGEGYDVVLANSGEEALAMLAVQSVDCILLDRLMPGLSGTETCRRLKENPATRDLPLIMLTAAEDRAAMIEGLATGADDYVLKSSEFDVLRARVRAQLRRKQFEDESRRIRAELARQALEAAEMRAARELMESRTELLRQLEQRNGELETMVAELREHEREIAEKNRQLEQADRLKSEFLSNMSHELRTPLNAIIGFSDLLAGGIVGSLTPTQQNCVNHVSASGKHLLALINDILDLSKVEAGMMELHLDAGNPNELLEGAFDIVREVAGKRHVSLQFEPAAGVGQMMLDQRKFKQMVYNLLSNAVKFCREGGSVRLAASVVGDAALRDGPRPDLPSRTLEAPPGPFHQWLQVLVSDDGDGIAADDLATLFQAFRQIDSSMSRHHEGTGLGLSLVSRLAGLHGGTVGVSSAPGQGAHFAFWLPLRLPQAETAPACAPTGKRALVVEDDPAAADLLRLQLEGAGFSVSCAADAASALAQARAAPPDLITLDLLLPDASGWSVLQQLRAEPGLEQVPVVVVSILDEEMRSCLLGAAHFLPKPMRQEDLNRALYALGLGAEQSKAPHVVLVDESANSVSLRAALAGLNYQVSYYADGPQAMAAARAGQVDLLVLGPMRDEAGGMALLDALRSDAHLPPPVLVLSERQPGAHAKPGLPHGGLDARQFLHEVGRALHARERTPWPAS